MRKKVIFLFFVVCLLSTLLISCGDGGNPTTPPVDDEQELPPDTTEPELIEIASKEINLEEGGVVEVTDPENELYGLKLTIEPQKNIKKDKGLLVTNIVIYLALLETCKLPDFQGFLITPFIIKSDFTDALFGKLEIPYWEEQLKNAGVAKNAPVKVCRVFSPPLPWVELSSDKYTDSNNIVNIPIGIGDFIYYYTLTVNNAVPPNSSGFKSPQPGDLLYKFSKLPPANINEGWCSGHVGIYVGEKYDEEEKKPYNVIEALLGGVTRSYHSPISKFGGNSIYLGAREPKSGLLQEQRNKIVAFAENAVGTPYSLIDTVSTMVFSGLGRGNLVKGYGNDFNCVGLAEAAYESDGVGIDLVSNYDEGNEIYGPYHILTPAEQWFNTVPATGNYPPVISTLTANPSSVDINLTTIITCIASDEDVGDTLTYTWTKNGGTFEGSTSGSTINWRAPNAEGNYTITCEVSDGELSDSEEVVVSVGDVNHTPIIENLTANPSSININETSVITCIATDQDDGDIITYNWSKIGGSFEGDTSGSSVTWRAPSTKGNYTITCEVSDGELSDSEQVIVSVGDGVIVQFEDPNLEQVIRETINKPSGALYLSDVAGITILDAEERGIESLEGIQHLQNLQRLILDYNQVSDISVLSNLTKLQTLSFSINQVSDISVLSNLTKLQTLSFSINQVSNISVLSNLTNLQDLSFVSNQVSDISALSNLTNLQGLSFNINRVSDISALSNLTKLHLLSISINQVSDISVLSNLTNLQRLYFRNNQVSDISALANNLGLGFGDEIGMKYNYLDLSEGSQDMQDIQTLINRGVDVEYEPQSTP